MTKQTGTQRMLHELILATFKPGDLFTADSFEVDDRSREQISHTLSTMKSKGLLVGGPIKGQYTLPNGPHAGDPETVVIDNLLDAMAAAEPILRKWKRIQEALDGIK